MADSFQKALKLNLNRTVSGLIGKKPIPLEVLLREFPAICKPDGLAFRGMSW